MKNQKYKIWFVVILLILMVLLYLFTGGIVVGNYSDINISGKNKTESVKVYVSSSPKVESIGIPFLFLYFSSEPEYINIEFIKKNKNVEKIYFEEIVIQNKADIKINTYRVDELKSFTSNITVNSTSNGIIETVREIIKYKFSDLNFNTDIINDKELILVIKGYSVLENNERLQFTEYRTIIFERKFTIHSFWQYIKSI